MVDSLEGRKVGEWDFRGVYFIVGKSWIRKLKIILKRLNFFFVLGVVFVSKMVLD